MNTASFFSHWGIAENPFRAEEARHDPVFSRLAIDANAHPDFEKIVGDLRQPSTAIVFGEKGSGKTAIRLQIESVVRAHNAKHPDAGVFLVAYDDLNPVLDRIVQRAGLSDTDDAAKALGAVGTVRLIDHMDAILHLATVRLVDVVLGDHADADISAERAKHVRRLPMYTRGDLYTLAAAYDRGAGVSLRMKSLRRRLGLPMDRGAVVMALGVWLGWLPAAALVGAFLQWGDRDASTPWLYGLYAALGVWGLVLLKAKLWDGIRRRGRARRIARYARALPRGAEDLAEALRQCPKEVGVAVRTLATEHDEPRYEMLARLKRVLEQLGCGGVLVLIDRLDEPSLVNGDVERMRSLAWPLMNNKFLQMPGIGIKALLPIELRHEIFRESSDFFKEARLDKQSLVERLSWTGASLYDLCNARLRACLAEPGKGLSVVDLFAEDVSRQDVVDALDQMHQPRDAFKLLYACIQEHCSNVTQEQGAWRISRPVLDTVRKQQAERVQLFYRGIRPA